MDKETWLRLEPVDPRPAYAWDCSNCGLTVYGSYLTAKFDSEEEELEVKSALGIETWNPEVDTEVVHVPRVLECPNCSELYRNAEVDTDWVIDEASEDWDPLED